MLGSQRVFQYSSLPSKNARCTPALRAAVTAARSPLDQYSSCPVVMNTACCRMRVGSRSVSSSVVEVSLKTFDSSQRTMGYSALNNQSSDEPLPPPPPRV